jgi:hypothetical protein
MANIKIQLIVDTEKLVKQSEVNQYCWFVDSENSPLSYLPEKYLSNVEPGQIIEWSGVPLNPYSLDCVSIDSITKENGKGTGKKNYDMFGTSVLIGSSGKIAASILAGGRPGDEETYTIRFTVIKSSTGLNTPFYVDPKLGVKN